MARVIDDPYNTFRHNLVDTSAYVIRHWPTPLVISQHGESVHTGARLGETPAENPVREAYYRWFNGTIQRTFPVGIRSLSYMVCGGLGDYFTEVTEGKGRLSNGYEWQMKRVSVLI